MNQQYFLETMRARLAEAHKKVQETQARAAAAQADLNVATQEFIGWQKAVEAEQRREQQEQAPSTTAVVLTSSSITITTPEPPSADDSASEVNKTDLIREQLRQHPAGITAPDLWKALSGKIVHRPYLYSVLKRLRDKDEVSQKRGKYFLKVIPKLEEEEKQAQLLQ